MSFSITRPLVLAVAFLGVLCVNVNAARHAITSFGAEKDQETPVTRAIQKAIDAAHADGGGTVDIPPGRWLSGTVFLKSKVTLHIEAGATLLASRNETDFIRGPGEQAPILIRADKARGISITGKGVIDGQAKQVWAESAGVDSFIAEETEIARKAGIDMKRAVTVKPNPGLVFLTDCSDVLVEDTSFLNSAFWSVHFGNCERVQIRNARIETSLDMGVNADGLDIDGCRDVRVTGCAIATGDDAICLKSTRHAGGRPCEDIVVTGCILTSTSCALKIGTETFGDFRRIVFSDCKISDSNRGIGIFVRDGAAVSDVSFSNLNIQCSRKHYNWWGDGEAMRFVVMKRNPESKLGSISRVNVSNVTAIGQGTNLIAGFSSDEKISDISLHNVNLTIEAEATADKRATHGLVIRDARGVTLDGLTIRWDPAKGVEPRWDKALLTERVENLETRKCKLDSPPFKK